MSNQMSDNQLRNHWLSFIHEREEASIVKARKRRKSMTRCEVKPTRKDQSSFSMKIRHNLDGDVKLISLNPIQESSKYRLLAIDRSYIRTTPTTTQSDNNNPNPKPSVITKRIVAKLSESSRSPPRIMIMTKVLLLVICFWATLALSQSSPAELGPTSSSIVKLQHHNTKPMTMAPKPTSPSLSLLDSKSTNDSNSKNLTASRGVLNPGEETTTRVAEEEDSEDGGENPANASNSDRKLMSVINGALSEVADKLALRLRANEETEVAANEEAEEDEESTTAATATILEVSGGAHAKEPAGEASNAERRPGAKSISFVSSPSSETASAKRNNQSQIAINKLQSPQRNQNNAGFSVANGRQPPSSAEMEERTGQMAANFKIYEGWREMGNDVIELVSRKFLPIVMEYGYEIDASTVSGILQVINGLRGLKAWALKIIDASTKISPGILLGTQSDFGDYDECLNVRVDDPSGLAGDGDQSSGSSSQASEELDPSTGLPKSTVVGRYCLADVIFPKPPREWDTLSRPGSTNNTQFAPIELLRPLYDFRQSADFRDTIFVETGNFLNMLYVDPIRVAICLTNKVDPDSFALLLNKLLSDLHVSVQFHGRCVTKYDRHDWNIFQRVSFWVVITATSLVALSSLIEVLATKCVVRKSRLPLALKPIEASLARFLEHEWQLLTSFSVLRNTRRLLKRPQDHINITKHEGSTKNLIAYESNITSQLGLSIAGQACKSSQRPGLISNRQQPVATSASQLGAVSLSTDQSSSSLESSPQIDRRSSSAVGSELQLIASLGSKLKQQPTSLSRNRLSHGHPSSILNEPELKADLAALHGIRVITMTWMIVNHTYMFGGFFVLWAHRRLIEIAEWPKSLSFQLVLNGWLTVETYFILSAMIIVLSVLPAMSSGKFSYFRFICHRLLRLLPAYTGLVCLNFLWPLISSGPVWMVKGESFIEKPCENYLWTNFLFINNWIWPEKQCMVHTWFLSADFQLYLLAPLIVWLLYRRPVLGHSLNILIAAGASLLSGFVIYANNLLPTTLINKLEFDSIKVQLSYSYFATYQHMGPYCLGLFLGYILHKRPGIRLPPRLTWLLWLLLPPLSFTTLMLTYLWNGAYKEPAMINPSPLVSAFYVAIHRIIWAALVSWIVFVCATRRAKLLSKFLSHYLFVPLSRLSFSIYLVHMPIIMFRALNLRHTKEWTDGNILWEACGNFVFSCILGYFLNVAFESPIINLEQAFMGCSRRAKPSDRFKAIGEDPKIPNHANLSVEQNGHTFEGAPPIGSDAFPDNGSSSSFSGGPQEGGSSGSSSSNHSRTCEDKVMPTPDSSSQIQAPDLDSSLKPTSNSHIQDGSDSEPLVHKYTAQSHQLVASGLKRTKSNMSHLVPRRHGANSSLGDQIYQLSSENYHIKSALESRAEANLFPSSELASSAGFERPSQYATLARTSRFTNQDYRSLLPLNRKAQLIRNQLNAGHLESRAPQLVDSEHHQQLATSSSQLGSKSAQLSHQMLQRRHSRYSMLAGSHHWNGSHQMQQENGHIDYEDASSHLTSDWPTPNMNMDQSTGHEMSWTAPIAGWLREQQYEQPGDKKRKNRPTSYHMSSSSSPYMIPRIDFSTMRRNSKLIYNNHNYTHHHNQPKPEIESRSVIGKEAIIEEEQLNGI